MNTVQYTYRESVSVRGGYPEYVTLKNHELVTYLHDFTHSYSGYFSPQEPFQYVLRIQSKTKARPNNNVRFVVPGSVSLIAYVWVCLCSNSSNVIRSTYLGNRPKF